MDVFGIRDVITDFDASLASFLKIVEQLARASCDRYGSEHLDLIQGLVLPKIAEIPSADVRPYTLEKGMIERVWRSAKTLKNDYDIAISIAKKGLWQSHLFRLAGWEVSDILSMRLNLTKRLTLPLDPLFPKLRGKRVLILENDVFTGNSIRSVSDALTSLGASKVDVFLLFGYLTLTGEEFDLAKTFVDSKRIIGFRESIGIRYENGLPIQDQVQRWGFIDPPEPQILKVGNVFTAEDFSPYSEDLAAIRQRLKRDPLVNQMKRKYRNYRL